MLGGREIIKEEKQIKANNNFWKVFIFLVLTYIILYILIVIIGQNINSLKGISDVLFLPLILFISFPILTIQMITGPIFGNFYPFLFIVIFAILNLFIQAFILQRILNKFKKH